jgi:hypothetical protein
MKLGSLEQVKRFAEHRNQWIGIVKQLENEPLRLVVGSGGNERQIVLSEVDMHKLKTSVQLDCLNRAKEVEDQLKALGVEVE